VFETWAATSARETRATTNTTITTVRITHGFPRLRRECAGVRPAHSAESRSAPDAGLPAEEARTDGPVDRGSDAVEGADVPKAGKSVTIRCISSVEEHPEPIAVLIGHAGPGIRSR
jgi:hypothetical protein